MQFGMLTQGLARATTASTSGPKLDITTFKLGSSLAAFNAAQTGLQGTEVYAGTVSSIVPYDSNTADVRIVVPSSDGPFSYGEIVLYLSDGTAVARAVYTSLQEKTASLTDGIGSSLQLHALIKLQNIATAINYNITNLTEILRVAASSISGPDTYGATVNAIIGLMDNPNGATNPILMKRSSGTQWSPEKYKFLVSATTAAGTNTTTVVHSSFGNATNAVAVQTTPAKRYLIQSTAGAFVSATSNGDGTATLSTATAWMAAGITIRIYDYDGVTSKETFNSPRALTTPALTSDSKELVNSDWFWQSAGMRAVTTAPAALSDAYRNTCIYNVAVANGGSGTLQIPGGLKTGGVFHVCNNSAQRIWITPSPNPLALVGAGIAYSGSFTVPPWHVARIWTTGSQHYAQILNAPSIGDIRMMAKDSVPYGYVECGSVLVAADYPVLYQYLGTTYNIGGEPGGSFRTPTVPGYFPRFFDRAQAVDTDARTVGDKQEDMVLAHKHVSATGEAGQTPFGGTTSLFVGIGSADSNNPRPYTNDGSDYDSGAVNPAGNIGAENRPKNVALLACMWAI